MLRFVRYEKENENGCYTSVFEGDNASVLELVDPNTSNDSECIGEEIYNDCEKCGLPKLIISEGVGVDGVPELVCECEAYTGEEGLTLAQYVADYVEDEPFQVSTIAEGWTALHGDGVSPAELARLEDSDIEEEIKKIAYDNSNDLQVWNFAPSGWLGAGPVVAGQNVRCKDLEDNLDDNDVNCAHCERKAD